MTYEERQNQVISLCQELIRAKSYSGEEEDAARVLTAFFEKNGYSDVHIDKYGSCVGLIKGKRPGPKLLFDGHLDTVPADSPDWTHDPFGGEIADGKLYGRGASDMKGALAAMAVAAADFARNLNYDFPGELYVAGTVHEECFEGIAAREVSAYARPDFVIIGEASELNVKIGQRGRAELIVETFGVPAHSANPEKGVNAVYKMCGVIERIRQMPPLHHPKLGYGIMELTDIKSSPYPGASVVPDYCRVTYDRRLLIGEYKESVIAPIRQLLSQMMEEDPELKTKVSYAKDRQKCYTGNDIEGERFFPGWIYEEGEPFAQNVCKELLDMNFKPEITQYNFCTNGSHYAGEAGIKTLGIGPSRENQAHTIDEYIEIEQLLSAYQAYKGVMKALLDSSTAA